MANIAKNFFKNLFSAQTSAYDLRHILSGIESCISKDEIIALMKPFNKGEIVNALKSMGSLKAFGIDGFPALFFQNCWHIVENEVSSYFLGVLNRNIDLEPMNVTNIVLIPKL